MARCICWGFFAPLHINHLSLFAGARNVVGEFGSVSVFVNDDIQLAQKKNGLVFMPENDRRLIVESIKGIDQAYIIHSIDQARELLELIKPHYMCMGGDKSEVDSLDPRLIKLCADLKIKILYGIGGTLKDRSSSEMIQNIINWYSWQN